MEALKKWEVDPSQKILNKFKAMHDRYDMFSQCQQTVALSHFEIDKWRSNMRWHNEDLMKRLGIVIAFEADGGDGGDGEGGDGDGDGDGEGDDESDDDGYCSTVGLVAGAVTGIGLGMTGIPGAQVPGAVIGGISALSGLAASAICNMQGFDGNLSDISGGYDALGNYNGGYN